MAIKKSVTVGIPAIFDGTSTVFTFDLARDNYGVTTGDPNGTTEGNALEVENWFTRTPLATPPSGIVSSGTFNGISFTASLSGTVVTVTYATAPPSGGGLVIVFLTF